MKKLSILLLLCVTLSTVAQNGSITYYHHGAVWSNGQTQGSGGFYVIVSFEDGEPSYMTTQLLNGGTRDYSLECHYDNEGYYYTKSDSNDKYRFSDDLTCMVSVGPPVMGMTMTMVYYNYPPSGNGNGSYGGSSYGGSYGGSSYGGTSGGSAYSKCRICGGSGVCTSCHGTGGEWRDTGYYTGSNTKSWINCPSCNGNKRCFNCHGTGRQ